KWIPAFAGMTDEQVVQEQDVIRALILDFGGTIVTMEGNAESARLVAAELDVPLKDVMAEVLDHPDWTDAMLGKYTIEEFDQRLYRRLGKPYDPSQHPLIYRMFANEVLNTGLLAVADEVRAQNGKAAILSNATFDLEERLLISKFGILDRFDVVVNSSRLGIIKPNPAIYHHTLDLLEVEPHEAIFVDDLPVNVEAAAALGIHAIHFRNEAQAVADIHKIRAHANRAGESIVEASYRAPIE
ncbi:MAG: HAD family phosphatase, partial [Anaerolineae bacterium]|nr:HAD family phosphatase [Anaerolineae bacterium]